MKKRIIACLAILALLCLAIAAYAYNRTISVSTEKASCCKKNDSCPMKGMAGHKESGEHAGMSCCKKHDEKAKSEGHSCCTCRGDSCPMKKDGETKATTVSATEGRSCCDNCDCCKGRQDTAV